MNQIYHYCEARAIESTAFFLDTLFEVSHATAWLCLSAVTWQPCQVIIRTTHFRHLPPLIFLIRSENMTFPTHCHI